MPIGQNKIRDYQSWLAEKLGYEQYPLFKMHGNRAAGNTRMCNNPKIPVRARLATMRQSAESSNTGYQGLDNAITHSNVQDAIIGSSIEQTVRYIICNICYIFN